MGPQLSDAEVAAVKSGTAAWQLPSAEALWLDPHVMLGGVLSLTTKLALHVAWLFAASFTVMVTTVVPRPTTAPAAGDWVITSEPDGVQLSVAETPPVKSGTTAWHEPSANALWPEAQVTIVGLTLSVGPTTRILNEFICTVALPYGEKRIRYVVPATPVNEPAASSVLPATQLAGAVV